MDLLTAMQNEVCIAQRWANDVSREWGNVRRCEEVHHLDVLRRRMGYDVQVWRQLQKQYRM